MHRSHVRRFITLFLATAAVGIFAVNRPARKPYPIAIWLVPAQHQQRQIQEIISGLAKEHSNSSRYIPVFQPHVTLFKGVLANKDDLADKLRALFGQVDKFCSRQKQVSLAVKERQPIGQRRSKWSQFLFVALETNGAPAEALDLNRAMSIVPAISDLELSTDADDDHLKNPAERRVMLHSSLIYDANSNDLSNIVEEVRNKYTLPDRLAFDAIEIVTPRSGDWESILTKSEDVNTNWDVIYRQELEPVAPSKPLRMAIAGGQTGVDQAALRAAQSIGLLTGGWCPPDRNIGDGKRVPDEFHCQETPRDASPDAPEIERSQRTQWNVRDADATLVLLGANPSPSDAGTKATVRFAAGYGRPVLICNPNDSRELDRVVAWVRSHDVRTLNVGGPSEKTEPGIGAIAQDFLSKVFSEVQNAD